MGFLNDYFHHMRKQIPGSNATLLLRFLGFCLIITMVLTIEQGAIGPWQEGVRGDTLARWKFSSFSQLG